jgi:hypothetical protein
LHTAHEHFGGRELEVERGHAREADGLGAQPPGATPRRAQVEPPVLVGEAGDDTSPKRVEERDDGPAHRDRIAGDDDSAHALCGKRRTGKREHRGRQKTRQETAEERHTV